MSGGTRGLWKKRYRTAGAGATRFLGAERAGALCTARSEALHRAQSRGVPGHQRLWAARALPRSLSQLRPRLCAVNCVTCTNPLNQDQKHAGSILASVKSTKSKAIFH